MKATICKADINEYEPSNCIGRPRKHPFLTMELGECAKYTLPKSVTLANFKPWQTARTYNAKPELYNDRRFEARHMGNGEVGIWRVR